ncbi:MAG: DUF3795 domain-containing protein [Oscillospiraceae bacterium]
MSTVQSRCGILCEKCTYECAGCVAIPNPFWGECPVKACCEGKQLEHCGLCDVLPCELLINFSYEKGENGDNGRRIEQCRCWAKQPQA